MTSGGGAKRFVEMRLCSRRTFSGIINMENFIIRDSPAAKFSGKEKVQGERFTHSGRSVCFLRVERRVPRGGDAAHASERVASGEAVL